MEKVSIKTQCIQPPIPTRGFDWAAWDDNKGADCSPIGRGATEQAAIDDLMEQLEDWKYAEQNP